MNRDTRKPPAIAKWLLEKSMPWYLDPSAMGDHQEIFDRLCNERGIFRAVCWYWFQVAWSFPPFILSSFGRSIGMFKNYFKTAWRNIIRNKFYSLINVSGLGFGMACGLLVFAFVKNELTYDHFHEKADKIFRVITRHKAPNGDTRMVALQPVALGKAFETDYPEIEKAVRFNATTAPVSNNEKSFTESVLFTDPGIFDVFTFPLLRGNAVDALQALNTIVITDELAVKFFGSTEAVGKTLEITLGGKKESFTITGIAASVPENSSIKFDILIRNEKHPDYDRQMSHYGSSNVFTYLLLKDEVHSADLEGKFTGFVKQHFSERIRQSVEANSLSGDDDSWKLLLQPIKDIHLNGDVRWGLQPKGDVKYTYILVSIAVFVMLIACINFMTLSIGRSVNRTKEVGMRRVMGAYRKQIAIQFLGESLLISIFSMIAGVLAANVLLPVFNGFAGKNLVLDTFSSGISFGVLLIIVLSVGIAAGGYPALLLAKVYPSALFQRSAKIGGKNIFTRSLTALQYCLSITLLLSTLVISGQVTFMKNKDLGYDKENILVIPAYSSAAGPRILNLLRQELAGNPDIHNMSGVNNAFARGGASNGVRAGDRRITTELANVDYNYIRTLGIEVAQGRYFTAASIRSENRSIVVNQAFADEAGWESPLGKIVRVGSNELTVIGVMKNYNFKSLHQEITPVLHSIRPRFANILIKIDRENMRETITEIEEAWNKVYPGQTFNYSFLDEDVDGQYRAEERWSAIIQSASLIAIFTACLGLLGLTSLSISNRVKEIGIRKVLGARIFQILFLVSGEFSLLLGFAFAGAIPLGYFLMNRWLQGFAYRIEVGVFTFFASGLIVFVLGSIVIGSQTIKAAQTNPVKTLRQE